MLGPCVRNTIQLSVVASNLPVYFGLGHKHAWKIGRATERADLIDLRRTTQLWWQTNEGA